MNVIKKYLILYSVVLFSFVGCGTLSTIGGEEPRNKIYSGVRADLESFALQHGSNWDLPFSFIFDTALLPYTLLVTAYNYTFGKTTDGKS